MAIANRLSVIGRAANALRRGEVTQFGLVDGCNGGFDTADRMSKQIRQNAIDKRPPVRELTAGG